MTLLVFNDTFAAEDAMDYRSIGPKFFKVMHLKIKLSTCITLDSFVNIMSL